MTYGLRLERVFDAPPDVVFDAFVDPATQERLHGAEQPDWVVHRCETDVRVGGTSTYAMVLRGRTPMSRHVSTAWSTGVIAWCSITPCRSRIGAGPFRTEMTITFEEREGKTLLTMVQTGFESEQDRDDFLGGWPSYLETFRGVVGEQLKARHDTDEGGRSEA